MWETAFEYLVSARDRLIHYKFLHRVYLTPCRLVRMFVGQQSLCWRCSAPLANFMHIFWDCPKVKPYWQAVAGCIRLITSISIPMSYEVSIASGRTFGHHQGNTDSPYFYCFTMQKKKKTHPIMEVPFNSNSGVLEGIG